MTAACHYHLLPSRLNLHQWFTLSLSFTQTVRPIWPKPILADFQSGGFNWLSGSSFGFVVKLISMVVGRRGVRQWLRVSELKWGSEGEEGLREAWVAAKEMRDLGLDNNYIYKGYFFNFKEIGFYLGQVSGQVLDFFIKPGPDPVPNRIR